MVQGSAVRHRVGGKRRRSQRVLVPQLYALVDRKTGTLQPGLISANGTTINLSGGLFNSGTLAARDNLAINAGSITNVLGQMQGNNVDLRARGGITSLSLIHI